MYKSKFTGPEVDDAIERVLNEETFNTSGRYPDMSVGFADDLVGRGESVPAEFSFRASGGKSIKDGSARIKRLKGNSVVWNQLIDPNLLAISEAELTDNGNELIIVPTTDANRYGYGINVVEGHYYLQSVDICSENGARVGFQNYLHLDITDKTTSTSYVRLSGIAQASSSGKSYVQLWGMENGAYRIKKGSFILIDLTKMFGAGYEPTTIEEYNARKPIVEDEYAHNEGEVIHMTAEGIKSIGDNAWDEEWESGHIDYYTGVNTPDSGRLRTKGYIRVLPNEEYHLSLPTASYPSDIVVICYDENKAFIQHIRGGSANKTFRIPTNCHYIRFTWDGTQYANNIMLSLVHSGWKQDTNAGYQPYWEDRLMFDQRIKDEFPDGMSKWDMVYNKNGKGYIVKGMYEVKIKDLNIRREAEGIFIAQPIPAVANTDSNGYSKEIVTARFIGDGRAYTYDISSYNCAFIVDNNLWMNGQSLASYLTVEDFIRDYGDDMLYYQLAEPTIIEYDEPFNLDYRVADFGTEEIIAPQPSAPLAADIIYQFNAVDMIREHELEITELQRIIATMQAQLTSLTSNNGGQ